MNRQEIANAKKLLRDEGYFVDNLWHVNDVTSYYECSNDIAYNILNDALCNHGTVQYIFSCINEEAAHQKLNNKKI